ncbi:MAG: hypothetical protein LBP32_05575 [Spirochaetaceae bacterium]|nr:hypothetical protein [Spirochaetaceae bacterium]
MPWRLVGFIILLGMVLVFIGVNLENSCDISFWFNVTIPGVPIYLTIFASFVLGMLCSLPLVVSSRFKKTKPRPKTGGLAAADKPKKRRGKAKKGDREPSGDARGENYEDGSFGID